MKVNKLQGEALPAGTKVIIQKYNAVEFAAYVGAAGIIKQRLGEEYLINVLDKNSGKHLVALWLDRGSFSCVASPALRFGVADLDVLMEQLRHALLDNFDIFHMEMRDLFKARALEYADASADDAGGVYAGFLDCTEEAFNQMIWLKARREFSQKNRRVRDEDSLKDLMMYAAFKLHFLRHTARRGV